MACSRDQTNGLVGGGKGVGRRGRCRGERNGSKERGGVGSRGMI